MAVNMVQAQRQRKYPPRTPSEPLPGNASINVHAIAAMPAYNEEKYIAKTIVEAYKYVNLVVVVDDGSTDSTAEVAEALGAYVVRHEHNKGYGEALRTIFTIAKRLDAGSLVIIDADGQHNPKDIPRLLQPLEKGADVVIGSRFLEGNTSDIPAYRKIGMKLLDTATNIAGDLSISDSQSGFRAYSKKAIEAIQITENGMSAGSEILINTKKYGLKIDEVPISVRYDIEDTSTHNPFIHGITVLNSIVGLIGYRRPLISFGILGLIFGITGLVTALNSFAVYTATSALPFMSTFISAMLLNMCMLLLTTGLILNYIVKFFRSNGIDTETNTIFRKTEVITKNETS